MTKFGGSTPSPRSKLLTNKTKQMPRKKKLHKSQVVISLVVRPLVELLKEMRDFMVRDTDPDNNSRMMNSAGMCDVLVRLRYNLGAINEKEKELLFNWIISNKPKFYSLRTRLGIHPSYFHFRPYRVKPRIKFVEKHIEELSWPTQMYQQ